MFKQQATTARHVYTVRSGSIFTPGVAGTSRPGYIVEKQPINQKTGKAWQATRTMQMFEDSEKAKALRFWLYAINDAKKQEA